MPTPTDIPGHIRALHASYEARTGYSIRYNPHRERQWWEWCKWADWEWTDRELAIVIGYLRSKINKGDRNDGALKFENLIGNPDRFEEDLNLANEARKGTPIARPKATRQTPDEKTASDGGEVFSGPEAVARFKALFQQP